MGQHTRKHSQTSELFQLQIEQTQNSHHLISVWFYLQVTDLMWMVNVMRHLTDTVQSQDGQSLFSSWEALHSQTAPISLDRDFHCIVVGSVQMTDRLRMVNIYIQLQTLSQVKHSSHSPKVDKSNTKNWHFSVGFLYYSLLGPIFPAKLFWKTVKCHIS